jgi:hypothetical protein
VPIACKHKNADAPKRLGGRFEVFPAAPEGLCFGGLRTSFNRRAAQRRVLLPTKGEVNGMV